MTMLALKKRALQQKQYLARLLAIYDAFQSYVETLKPLVKGEQVQPEFLRLRERFRLKFEEYQQLFLEWRDGDQFINEGVAALLYRSEEFSRDEVHFRLMLTVATAKFEDTLEKAARLLRELHEEIALEEGQNKAEQVTAVPQSALGKMKDADALAEIATKWLGRVVRFAPWAYDFLKSLHP